MAGLPTTGRRKKTGEESPQPRGRPSHRDRRWSGREKKVISSKRAFRAASVMAGLVPATHVSGPHPSLI